MTHSEQDKMHQVSQHAVAAHLDSGAGPCCPFETLKFLSSRFANIVSQLMHVSHEKQTCQRLLDQKY